MQRRNFISNLAVILPAGMVAPKLLFESKPSYKKIIQTRVLVLGAGTAGLFIAQKLKKEQLSTLLLEPSGGTNQSAVYNHTVTSGVIRQKDKHQKAEVETILHHQYQELEEMITLNFIPTEITKTADGFIVTDDTTAYSTTKLILALPVQIDSSTASVRITLSDQHKDIVICCKRKKQRNPAIFSTLSAEKIDEQQLLKFAHQKSPGILAIL
jgi:monoamine oxidase